MSKIEKILAEIDHLNTDDLELILSEIKRKINRKNKAEAVLNDFIGKGKGVWVKDAQTFVNELREEDRPIQ